MNNTEAPIRNIVVAVDVQNDFITGSLAVNGGTEVVEPINQLAQKVRSAMGKIVFTRDEHPAVTPHFTDYGGVWPIHCVAGTEGAAFHPNLDVRDEDSIISKGMGQTDGYSGWEGISDDGATLETIITPRTPDEKVHVLFTGLATDYCVKATDIDTATRFRALKNVGVYAVLEAMRAVNMQEGDEARAIAEMQAAGVKIITLDQAFTLIDTARIE